MTGFCRRAFLCSCQSNRPPSRSPSRPPTQERGPRRQPSPDDPDAGSERHRSPTRAGGFVVAGAVAPTATSIRVGTIRTEHQRLLREAWKRAPLLHFGSRVNPVRNSGRSHQLVGLATLRLPSDLQRFELRALRRSRAPSAWPGPVAALPAWPSPHGAAHRGPGTVPRRT